MPQDVGKSHRTPETDCKSLWAGMDCAAQERATSFANANKLASARDRERLIVDCTSVIEEAAERFTEIGEYDSRFDSLRCTGFYDPDNCDYDARSLSGSTEER